MAMAQAARRGLLVLAPLAGFLALGSLIPHFLDVSNLLNVVRQSSIIGICAVGMTFVIIIKGIDLSLAGLLELGGHHRSSKRLKTAAIMASSSVSAT